MGYYTLPAGRQVLCVIIRAMLERLLLAPVFLIALTIHELAHALAADRLGDPTPRSQGRISLNPLKHLDPYGAILFLLTGLGWAKPVVFDPYNLRHPRKDAGLISLAGPASNLLLALIASLLLNYLTLPVVVASFLYSLIYINTVLAIFNLVPVYPLDGEKILAALLPRDLAFEYQAVMSRYGTLILILLILPLFGPSPIASLIFPVISFVTRLFMNL